MAKILSRGLLVKMQEVAKAAAEAPGGTGLLLKFRTQQEAIHCRKQLYKARRYELTHNPNSLLPLVSVETRLEPEGDLWVLHIYPQGGKFYMVEAVDARTGEPVRISGAIPLSDEELAEMDRQGEILQIQEELLAATWPPRKASWKAEVLHKAGHRPGDPVPEYNGRHDRALYVDPRAKTYADG